MALFCMLVILHRNSFCTATILFSERYGNRFHQLFTHSIRFHFPDTCIRFSIVGLYPGYRRCSFSLSVNSNEDCLLMISHPLFATSLNRIELRDSITALGEQFLISKRQLLQEVIIMDKRAIVIKGDTVEYNADSFQTAAYDNVDELLKKLPGIEIDGDGSIKAYGEKVQKMLVDGEEFFSDDPAVVAQTLRASSIDKVQVFNKKSDQAACTVI